MAALAKIEVEGDTLTLSGVLDFDTVQVLQVDGARWVETLAPAAFTLDLAGVTYSSSAGLALLLDWLRTAQQVKKQPCLRGMPADMLALARVSGLEGILPLA